MERASYCAQCGRKVEEDAHFCAGCGRRLDPGESVPLSSPARADALSQVNEAVDHFEEGEFGPALSGLRQGLDDASRNADEDALGYLVDMCRQMVEYLGDTDRRDFESILAEAEEKLFALQQGTLPERLIEAREAFAGGDLGLAVHLLHVEILDSYEDDDAVGLRRVVGFANEMALGLAPAERWAFEDVIATASRRLEELPPLDPPQRALSRPARYRPVEHAATLPARPLQQSTNGLAIASLVLGIVWLYWVGSILALVFGYVAKAQIDRSGGLESGRGMAVAGIVLGWIGVAVLVVLLIVGVSVFGAGG